MTTNKSECPNCKSEIHDPSKDESLYCKSCCFKSIDTIMSAATPALPDREQILEFVQKLMDSQAIAGVTYSELLKVKRFIEGQK